MPDTKLIGRISSSQLIGIFGIGALYDLRAYSTSSQTVTSVIVSGLDDWSKHRVKLRRITEPALQHALGVPVFYAPPPPVDESDVKAGRYFPFVPVYRFPLWMVCNSCDRLGVAGYQFNDRRPGNKCLGTNCRGHGVPVRLVTTCFPAPGTDPNAPHPGHIDEFPWHAWAHSHAPGVDCSADAPELKLNRSGRSAALSGLRVICLKPDCLRKNIGRSLDGVFGDTALRGHTCSGHRPWLQDEEPCNRPIRALMRGASNVYFPVTASALSIPPTSSACRQGVADVWHNLKAALDAFGLDTVNPVQGAEMVMNMNGSLRRYTHDQIWSAVRELADPAEAVDRNFPTTSDEQRVLERQAIVEGRRDDDASGIAIFEAERIDRARIQSDAPNASAMIESLVLLHRLREVRVLRGFHRLESVSAGDPYSIPCAPLSRNNQKWLPAIEVYGEGIYFELERGRLSDWARRPAVLQRVAQLQRRVANGVTLTPEFVLIHTLTHLLINQLSLDCGYSSSSLRERIYVGGNDAGDVWSGALIYTATTNSDGTLGGLVRQGRPEFFGKSLQAAIENATWCSSDPLCIESAGQGVDALNLAACHACAIVSETSCEHRNVFLDRALVVGTPDQPEAGFFVGTELLGTNG